MIDHNRKRRHFQNSKIGMQKFRLLPLGVASGGIMRHMSANQHIMVNIVASKKVYATIPSELYESLETLARMTGESNSWLIRRAVSDLLDNYAQNPKQLMLDFLTKK
jgi:Ribbon-helix-helix protein, copG family